MEKTKSIIWRIWMAIILTSLGVLYYLSFLFFWCAGVPIEKIHYFMTDGWPNICADLVPWVAPVFLFSGLYFWYSYNVALKPKTAPEPEYTFEFNKVEKSAVILKPAAEFDDIMKRKAKVVSPQTEPEPVIAPEPEPELFFGMPTKPIKLQKPNTTAPDTTATE